MKRFSPLFFLIIAFTLTGCSPPGQSDKPGPPTFESVKLTADDTANNDHFGFRTTLDGDTALVGAHNKNGTFLYQGAAYIYYRNQGGPDAWGQVKKLVANDPEYDGEFGMAVALSGDTALVGASQENGAGADQGAVYVHYRDQGGSDNWGFVKKLVSDAPVNNNRFGFAIDLDGDYALVSEKQDGSGAGAVSLLGRNQGGADNWGLVKKLVSDDGQTGDVFGWSVDLSGDYAVAGAIFVPSDATHNNVGAVYIFHRNQGGNNNWGQVKKLTPFDGVPGTWFGYSVAMDGDEVLVGSNTHGVYLFSRNQGGVDAWGFVKKLTPDYPDDAAGFGISVALAGDQALLGADRARGNRGVVYRFSRNQGGNDNWGEVDRYGASDGADGDRLGCSFSLSGNEVLAGAYSQDGDGIDRGAAYLFAWQ